MRRNLYIDIEIRYQNRNLCVGIRIRMSESKFRKPESKTESKFRCQNQNQNRNSDLDIEISTKLWWNCRERKIEIKTPISTSKFKVKFVGVSISSKVKKILPWKPYRHGWSKNIPHDVQRKNDNDKGAVCFIYNMYVFFFYQVSQFKFYLNWIFLKFFLKLFR
jgi:hypothetical protein